MNYKLIYDNLIEKCIHRDPLDIGDTYSELHHIIPVCMGGSNESSNLVRLTAREHILAHILLAKSYPSIWKLGFAVSAMTMNANGLRGVNTKNLALRRSILAKSASMRPPTYGNLGKKHSAEVRKKISENTSKAMKGIKQSKEHIENKIVHKRKSVIARSISGDTHMTFKCIRDAESLGFKSSAISRCCNGLNKTHKGFTWSFTGSN